MDIEDLAEHGSEEFDITFHSINTPMQAIFVSLKCFDRDRLIYSSRNTGKQTQSDRETNPVRSWFSSFNQNEEWFSSFNQNEEEG